MPREQLAKKGEAGRMWLLENRRWDVLARGYLEICDALCESTVARPVNGN
jgi:hypothetical protein